MGIIGSIELLLVVVVAVVDGPADIDDWLLCDGDVVGDVDVLWHANKRCCCWIISYGVTAKA